MLHEIEVVLFDCKPLSARMSRENCAATRKKSRGLKFNNDYEGAPFMYGKCLECSGVTGAGERVTITAGPPRPPRVAVLTIDGGYGYV